MKNTSFYKKIIRDFWQSFISFRGIKTAISIALIVSICILIAPVKTFADECSEIRNNVLRLHILANSNTDADQELKIKVRDRVLKDTKDCFNLTVDSSGLNKNETLKDRAIKSVEEKLNLITKIAEDEIKINGYNYKVKTEIVNMFFKTKTYDNQITLPAGNYDAVRILIGDGTGDNWWCVMFPPLCLPAAERKTDTIEMNDVLTENEVEITENKNKYEFKFAIVEFFENVSNMISEWFK